MLNDKMSREEAERWLAELTADPELPEGDILSSAEKSSASLG